jgi:hypothetical protein
MTLLRDKGLDVEGKLLRETGAVTDDDAGSGGSRIETR